MESLSERIRECNERIEELAQKSYPQVALLKQIKGVGTLIALCRQRRRLDVRLPGTDVEAVCTFLSRRNMLISRDNSVPIDHTIAVLFWRLIVGPGCF